MMLEMFKQEMLYVVVVSAVGLLATIGAIHLVGDFREFRLIVEQCETQGYIQNTQTRVLCAKDTQNAKP